MKFNKVLIPSLLVLAFSVPSNASSYLESIRNIPDSIPVVNNDYEEAMPRGPLPSTDSIKDFVKNADDAESRAKMENHFETPPEIYREEDRIGSTDYDSLQGLAAFSMRSKRCQYSNFLDNGSTTKVHNNDELKADVCEEETSEYKKVTLGLPEDKID